MAHFILKELEGDLFGVDHIIETLTYKATDGKVGQQNFNPLNLEEIFVRTIEDLKRLSDKTKQRIDILESDCIKEKLECKDKIVNIENLYKESFDKLITLDKRISEVSANMSDMGSQLENLNKPRTNLSESHKLAKYYDKFMENITNSGVFADDTKLEQAADVIYKLHVIAGDLNDPKFENANKLIEIKYNQIEKNLIQAFMHAFALTDKKSMKKYINILSNFRGYQDFISSEFIRNSQASLSTQRGDIFNDILPLCIRMNDIINDVFTNNERIMEQFIKDLFLGKVQSYITETTRPLKETDTDKYLDTIYVYYNKNKKLFKDLSEQMKLSTESTFFTKLMHEVYQQHLKDYVVIEKQNLQNKYKNLLDRFYSQTLQHTKRNFQGFGFVSNLLSKPQSNANEVIDDRFLSHDITAVCIDDAKKSLQRIQLLCDLNNQAKAIEDICDIISTTLCKEHFAYALDLHSSVIQSMDFKQDLNIQLFKTIKQLNNLIYLYERFLNTTAIPIVSGTVNYSKIITKHKQVYNDLESKVDIALEKAFSLICAHIRHILQVEQKPTDFRPETNDIPSGECTQACNKALRVINTQIDLINECFDGKNVNSVLKELGLKFHRSIYDHVFRQEYNELGALILIRDINEYRITAKRFNSPNLISVLFDTLYSLGNLLIAAPANLQEICSTGPLSILNKDIVETFVRLRTDNKNFKLQSTRA